MDLFKIDAKHRVHVFGDFHVSVQSQYVIVASVDDHHVCQCLHSTQWQSKFADETDALVCACVCALGSPRIDQAADGFVFPDSRKKR